MISVPANPQDLGIVLFCSFGFAFSWLLDISMLCSCDLVIGDRNNMKSKADEMTRAKLERVNELTYFCLASAES